jgi:hypothetical protein
MRKFLHWITGRRPARLYFSLIVKDATPGALWRVAFGSVDRADVTGEMQKYSDKGWKRSQLQIISTNGKRGDIDAWVDAFNGRD